MLILTAPLKGNGSIIGKILRHREVKSLGGSHTAKHWQIKTVARKVLLRQPGDLVLWDLHLC